MKQIVHSNSLLSAKYHLFRYFCPNNKTTKVKFKHLKYLSYFLFFTGLYFAGRYAVNALAFLIVISVAGMFKEGVRPWREFPKLLVLPIIFYFWHIISLFYSANRSEALFDLEVKFSFLLLPLILGFQKPGNPKEELIQILRIYLASTLFSMLLLATINIPRIMEAGRMLYYNDYSFLLHPSYLSMYLSFALLAGVYLLFEHKGNKICILAGMLLSFVMLGIAESKAGQLSALALVVFILYRLIPLHYRKWTAIISIVLILIFAYTAKDSKRFSFFIKAMEHYSEIKEHPETIRESTALRVLSWSASWETLKQNPVAGVGCGDIKDELSVYYEAHNYTKPLEMHMNAHNQYLETAVGQGLIGFILLVLLLLLPLFYIQNSSILIQGFILIVGLNLLVESMFNTQAGVIFIAFFYSYLISRLSPHKS
jgi:O-antigen ligase